jgi:phosphatidylglycerol lysyltransferase
VTTLNRLQRVVPVVVSLAIIVLAANGLVRMLRGVHFANVLQQFRAIAPARLSLGALLVTVLYSALAIYEAIMARFVGGPVSARRAALGALLAAPIGHVIGWGAVSGGAIRYKIYRAVLMRPLDVGKMALLAAIPYPAGLGLLLGLSLVLQSGAAGASLHVPAELARSAGLGLLVLHGAYLTMILRRRAPLALGRLMLTLPTPSLTAVQYCIGLIEVCCGASVLYVLLPDDAGLSFIVFVGVYVLSILAGLASSIPAGLGVFETVLLALLMHHVSREQLLGAVLAYRVVFELAPLGVALVAFAGYEAWWRLPAQRTRLSALLARRPDDG